MERPRNKETEPKRQAAVIGGEGAMGKTTADLFRKMGLTVRVSDIANPSLPSAREAIESSQIIFLSVPAQEIPSILDQSGDLITRNHLIIDNSSVKRPFAELFIELDRRGVSVCSTHPLAKPDVLSGEKVLIMNVGRNSQRARQIALELFQIAQMEPVELDFLEHDKSMAIAQGWAHICSWAEALAFAQNGVSIDTILKLASPNSKLKLASTARTLTQTPELSATIIASALSTEEGREFLDSVIAMLQMLRDQPNPQVLAQTFTQTRNNLDSDGTVTRIGQITPPLIDILKGLV